MPIEIVDRQIDNEERWFTLSIAEQLGNIGSEVGRAIRARGNQQRFLGAVSRALELFYLTVEDPRWRGKKRLREILRARELFCAAALGSTEYKTTLEDLDKYFGYFALVARSEQEQSRQTSPRDQR